MEMKLGVVISTYNNPTWLEKTLWGYLCQQRMADEVIIADDGSGEATRQLVEHYASQLPIKHVWHEDQGFRKTKILNEALRVAESEYLVFTDQDCIPRADFLATHERLARQGCFLSGGYCKLPMALSEAITQADGESQRAFSLAWLRAHGLHLNFKSTKLLNWPWYAWLMNTITHAHATWNGMNSSGWRDDLLAARGFDERMRYGGEDREMGERLINAGIQSSQIRYSAIALHLDHDRPYIDSEALEQNRVIRRHTRSEHITATEYGL